MGNFIEYCCMHLGFCRADNMIRRLVLSIIFGFNLEAETNRGR